ncbi:hypothetical protein [Haloechinothrix halophila]|uniref:Uncharacterized protein n=1 Tax=Haloechinothrix halophila YIM 93223 TaxID=592678 RepID=W9DSD1_9PSEU|nr:hypothetical protein [Haloechinothrix halophila]ETA66371.1 hypothetical protein AmyhaDRAFT_0125 [Haloechinothrix halophila YIM 93223]
MHADWLPSTEAYSRAAAVAKLILTGDSAGAELLLADLDRPDLIAVVRALTELLDAALCELIGPDGAKALVDRIITDFTTEETTDGTR